MKWLSLAALMLAVAAAAWIAIERVNVPPRRLAIYVERRAAGHRAAIESIGHFAAGILLALDRGRRSQPALPIPTPLAQAMPPTPGDDLRRVAVASPEEALRAIGDAKPGDAITFLPGTYRFDGTYIAASRPAIRHAIAAAAMMAGRIQSTGHTTRISRSASGASTTW